MGSETIQCDQNLSALTNHVVKICDRVARGLLKSGEFVALQSMGDITISPDGIGVWFRFRAQKDGLIQQKVRRVTLSLNADLSVRSSAIKEE